MFAIRRLVRICRERWTSKWPDGHSETLGSTEYTPAQFSCVCFFFFVISRPVFCSLPFRDTVQASPASSPRLGSLRVRIVALSSSVRVFVVTVASQPASQQPSPVLSAQLVGPGPGRPRADSWEHIKTAEHKTRGVGEK